MSLAQEGASLVENESAEREPRGAYYEDALRFPGYGYQPQRCQGLQPVGFCREHAHVVLGRDACNTRRCPEDWRGWLEEAVISAVARLAAYRHHAVGWEKRLVHVAVSAPQNRRYTTEAFWDARTEANDVAKEVGVRGGMLVPHPYRTTDAGDEFFEIATEEGDWDRGKYALFRDAADDWDEMGEYVEPAPHFHVLGPAEDVSGEQARGDWVAKNIVREDRSALAPFYIDEMEGYREMASVAYYVLTHAAVQDGRNTVSWFGEVHGSNFKPEEALEAEEWAEIQRRAERAVRTREDDEEVGEWHEEMECPREECESVVLPIEQLATKMADVEWFGSLEEEERRILQGLQMWLDGDRPPPSAHTSERAMLDHLEEKGRISTHITTHQAFIGAFD